MKALCLLIIFANIAVALWEYRYSQDPHPSQAGSLPGAEEIVLVSEATKTETSSTNPEKGQNLERDKSIIENKTNEVTSTQRINDISPTQTAPRKAHNKTEANKDIALP